MIRRFLPLCLVCLFAGCGGQAHWSKSDNFVDVIYVEAGCGVYTPEGRLSYIVKQDADLAITPGYGVLCK